MSLKAEHITFSYEAKEQQKRQAILSDFSAEFHREEMVAVTGANGCGKTTLSKLLVGILKPLRGTITLNGAEINQWTLAEIGRKIGYVMQNPMQQLFCTTVAEEIEFGLRNLGLTKQEIEKRREEYLNYFQIAEYREEFPFLLSQGEKQRVVLAAILAMKPEYLILDEPTASLDLYRQKLLEDYLIRVKKELQCGIIIISHDSDFIKNCAQREITW